MRALQRRGERDGFACADLGWVVRVGDCPAHRLDGGGLRLDELLGAVLEGDHDRDHGAVPDVRRCGGGDGECAGGRVDGGLPALRGEVGGDGVGGSLRCDLRLMGYGVGADGHADRGPGRLLAVGLRVAGDVELHYLRATVGEVDAHAEVVALAGLGVLRQGDLDLAGLFVNVHAQASHAAERSRAFRFEFHAGRDVALRGDGDGAVVADDGVLKVQVGRVGLRLRVAHTDYGHDRLVGTVRVARNDFHVQRFRVLRWGGGRDGAGGGVDKQVPALQLGGLRQDGELGVGGRVERFGEVDLDGFTFEGLAAFVLKLLCLRELRRQHLEVRDDLLRAAVRVGDGDGHIDGLSNLGIQARRKGDLARVLVQLHAFGLRAKRRLLRQRLALKDHAVVAQAGVRRR